jgi:hypothetical protein
MIGAGLCAAVGAAVLAAFRREFRQVAPGAIRDVACPCRQYHRDGIVFAHFLEERQDFPNRIAAQSVSFLRPVDRDFRHRSACF